jgi:ribonuclease D
MSAPTPNRHRRPGPAFRERPTREQIAELPPFDPLPLERIVVVETTEQAEAALRAMTHARFVGFDTESKPTFTREAVRDGPHVIQFATDDQGFIVQVNDRTPIAFLREVLESEAIVKVGFGLDSDRGPVEHKLHTRLRASVEVSQVLRSLGHKQALGAKAAVAVVLGRRLTKSKSVTTSNWGAARLSPQQLLYAANDAYAALKVFEAMGSPYP